MATLKTTEEWYPSIAKSSLSLQDITLANDKSHSFPTNLSALAALFPVLREAFDSETSVIIFCDTDDRTLSMLDDFVHTGKVAVGTNTINAKDLKMILQSLGLSNNLLTMDTVGDTETKDPLDIVDDSITDDYLPMDASDIAVKDEPNVNEYLSMELHEEKGDTPTDVPKEKKKRNGRIRMPTGRSRGRPRKDRSVAQEFAISLPIPVPSSPAGPGQFRTILPRPIVLGHLVQLGPGHPMNPLPGFLNPGKVPLHEKPHDVPKGPKMAPRKGRPKIRLEHGCDLCGEEFSSEAGVIEHVQSLHGFSFCTICCHSFKNVEMLEIHKNRVHSCTCKVCGKVFKHNTALALHIHADHQNNP